MFPALAPGVPVLRRAPQEVQLGIDPSDELVLTGLTDTEIGWLERLDGSRSLNTFGGAGGDRFRNLVIDLARRGVVVDAHHPPGPASAVVAIDGEGVTSRTLAGLLRDAGVTVLHGPSAVAETDLARRSGREPLVGGSADLVVGVVTGAVSPIDRWWGDDVPYLPVLVRPRSTTVGPVVTASGPCLHCLDLTRSDHDPAWAALLAQMGRVSEPDLPSPVTTGAAALACDRILEFLTAPTGERPSGPDGTPPEESVEMSFSPVRLRRRTWARHPRCPRH